MNSDEQTAARNRLGRILFQLDEEKPEDGKSKSLRKQRKLLLSCESMMAVLEQRFQNTQEYVAIKQICQRMLDNLPLYSSEEIVIKSHSKVPMPLFGSSTETIALTLDEFKKEFAIKRDITTKSLQVSQSKIGLSRNAASNFELHSTRNIERKVPEKEVFLKSNQFAKECSPTHSRPKGNTMEKYLIESDKQRKRHENSENEDDKRNPFMTASDKLNEIRRKHPNDVDDNKRKYNKDNDSREHQGYHPMNSQIKRRFTPPSRNNTESNQTLKSTDQVSNSNEQEIDPRLRSCDPALIQKIEMEIIDQGDVITFEDIAGLDSAKTCINELVIWPMARPDIFTGLRSLPKGLLLFGPPGTGKTLIGKALAHQSGATFFSISASSLTSKWIGEGEKLVRTLFAVAATKQPAVIFIDEIDSMLTQRSADENEASRRIKTEFLVQLDGAGTKSGDVILVVGATNRPQELDEAARRRFVKRLYIPLPTPEARLQLISKLLEKNDNNLNEKDKEVIVANTKGFSGADLRALCTEAAMGPIRSCTDIRAMDASSIRPIERIDFDNALKVVRATVSTKDLDVYLSWNNEFGSFPIETL